MRDAKAIAIEATERHAAVRTASFVLVLVVVLIVSIAGAAAPV